MCVKIITLTIEGEDVDWEKLYDQLIEDAEKTGAEVVLVAEEGDDGEAEG